MKSATTKTDPMDAYRLGVAAGVLMMEQPQDWQRKLRANARKAKKLGVEIDAENIFDNIPAQLARRKRS